MKCRKLLGVYYEPDKLNGWNIGTKGRPKKPTWIMDEYGCVCISHDRVMAKWSVAGVICVAWHPQPVTDEDYRRYVPPAKPQGIELKWDDQPERANQ